MFAKFHTGNETVGVSNRSLTMTRLSTPRLTRRRLLAAGAALPFASMAGPAFAQAPVRFGTASLGSTGYVIIEAIAATVNKHSDLRTTSMSTSGGAENLQLIGQNALDFGQSASNDYQAARAGEGRFKQPIDMHQTFAYTAWPRFRWCAPTATS